MFGEQARHGAPDQRFEVLGTHDDACHGGGQAQLSEVQGEEGEEAGSSAGAQEVEGSGQSEGSPDVNLLVPLHDWQLTVSADGFHMEQLVGRNWEINREMRNTTVNTAQQLITTYLLSITV